MAYSVELATLSALAHTCRCRLLSQHTRPRPHRSGCRQVRAGPIACNRYPAKNLSKHLPQPAFCKWASNIQPTKPSGFCRPALFSLPCASRARADEETHRHRALRAAPSLPTAVRAASSLPPAVWPPPRSLRQCRAPQNPLHKRLKNPHHHHAGGGNRQAPQQQKTTSAPPSKTPSV